MHGDPIHGHFGAPRLGISPLAFSVIIMMIWNDVRGITMPIVESSQNDTMVIFSVFSYVGAFG